MGWFWKRESGRNEAIKDLKNLHEDATIVAMSKDDKGFHITMTPETGVDEAIGMLFMGMQHLAVRGVQKSEEAE